MSETPYIVSARKYRPATFRSVVGQKALTTTLKNAIDSHRLAQAYLFTGPRGVGKTSCARIFAKTINCLSPTPDGEACGHCESCVAIDKGTSYNLIELDAASNNGVDQMREIGEQVNIPPQVGKYRVFIIDEVHMLTNQAFNAFLKTLEEPPSYVIFILATTEKHKVIPTILSRCQIYDFKRITVDDMVDHLKYVAESEGIQADPKALGVIARKADGAMRDALSIFDQIAASSQNNITYQSAVENLNVLDYDFFFRLIDTFVRSDISEALLIYKEARDRGFDSLFFINGLGEHIRDLMVAADPRTVSLLQLPSDAASMFVEKAKSLPIKWYYAAVKIVNETDLKYRTATNKQLLVEIALIRLCQLLNPAEPPFDGADPVIALRNPVATPRTGASQVSATPGYYKPSPEAPKPEPVASEPTVETSPQTVMPDTPQSSSSPTPPVTTYQSPVTPSSTVRGRNRPSSMRISEESVPQIEFGVQKERAESFTQQQLTEAWNSFVSENSELRILTSAMRNSAPVRVAETEYLMKVSHPAELQAFEQSAPKLLAYLRDKVSNDRLIIRVEIDDKIAGPKMKSPKEFLLNVLEENPALAGFLKDINAEMV